MQRLSVTLWLSLVTSITLVAQSLITNTGIINGSVTDQLSRGISGVTIGLQEIPSGFRITILSDQYGRFHVIVPSGTYALTATSAKVKAAENIDVRPASRKEILIRFDAVRTTFEEKHINASEGFARIDTPGSFAIQRALKAPWVSEPVNLTGSSNSIRPLLSQNAFSWTATSVSLEGMSVTDSYQPGSLVLLGDGNAVSAVLPDDAGNSSAVVGLAADVNLFLKKSSAGWHGQLTGFYSGMRLASDNLPPVGLRGNLLQSERFKWLSNDNAQIGGPIGARGGIFLSAGGAWDSRLIPAGVPGETQNSRILLADGRGHYQLTSHDQLNAQYSGSRIDNSNWTQPAALEALVGWRMMPTLDLPPYGINGLAEVDHMDSIQVGWSHEWAGESQARTFELRYQFLPGHFDTFPDPASSGIQSRSELTTGVVTGAPPLSNMASRISQQIASAFQTRVENFLHTTHELGFGASFSQGKSRNRFTAPGGLNLITASGAAAEAVELNMPLDSRQISRDVEIYGIDRIHLASFLTASAGVLSDFSRGSLPPQSSPAGPYAPIRQFPAERDVIDWNNVSPQAGFALRLPHWSRLILRANYSRRFAPLAGQYLDFANPNSLSGMVYAWSDANGDGAFQSVEQGALLRRFGGAYSSVSRALHRPYSDEFNVAAESLLPANTTARIQFYRRDDKNRLAVVNVGVPSSAYSPVVLHDPGPDFVPNTFDDQTLTGWNQDPGTLGQDRYLLTNPADLRMMFKGFTATIRTKQRYFMAQASFTAERSYGPTNPGDGVLENDSGVVGALYQDPNTLINATNRSFFDRAYVGGFASVTHLPKRLANLDISNSIDYMDGLAFARQLLVSGFNQGPFLLASTVRGSPEGGNRAEYYLNWNLRVSRNFQYTWGFVTTIFDLMNVRNSRNSVQESDISGPEFNSRLPVAIEPARFARIGVRIEF